MDEILYTEDYTEMALEPVILDDLVNDQYAMDYLLAYHDTTNYKCTQALVDQQQYADVQDFTTEDSFCCDLAHEQDSDDDAHVLLSFMEYEDEKHDEDWNQIWDQTQRPREKLSHMTSTSFLRVCHCTEAHGDAAIQDVTTQSVGQELVADPYNASREYLDMYIRYAVVVRVVKIETVDGIDVFVLKVCDPETNMRWETKKTFRDMMRFYSQIQQLSLVQAPVKKAFWGTLRGLRKFKLPNKLFVSRGSLNTQRQMAFDSLLRQTATLVTPAPLGPRRRKALLLLQEFVDVHRHCNEFDRDVHTCFLSQNKMDAAQLVAKIFAAPGHKVLRECYSFVSALTQKSVDVKHAFMPKWRARTLLNTMIRKMKDVKNNMLKDEALLVQLAVAHSERSEPDYDEFLDEVKYAICTFVQKHILVLLEDHVYEALTQLTNRDDESALKDKIKILQTKPQSFFGVPSHVVDSSGSDWEDARRELRRVNEYALPLDKLKCLARAAGAIFQTYGSPWSSSCVDTTSNLASVEETDTVLRPSMTTDEFISVHLFVLVMSNMSQLLITREFLRVMCDPQDTSGELGYYLTTFEAAVDLLVHHADPQQPMLV